MSEVDNLGSKSVGNTENSHACYLAAWRHARSPPPEKNLSFISFETIFSTIYLLIKYVATGSFKNK